MKKKAKILVAIVGVGVVGAIVAANLAFDPDRGIDVESRTVERKDLYAIVSASGKLQPRRVVDLSTEVSGKVINVAVEEGETVVAGQLVLQIDPKPLLAQMHQLEASCGSSRASIVLTEANLAQARNDLARMEKLSEDELISLELVQQAHTEVEVQKARLTSAQQDVVRLEAALEESRHQLSKVDIHSDIAGTVIGVYIESGETAFVGAFNNPATVLLTVADLSEIEAVVEVDETEAVRVAVGQRVEIEVDAHPDWVYHGRVVEVGHSPVRRQTGGEREGTAFEVKIAALDEIPQVRPGLTCSTAIETSYVQDAVAVPIQALTLRKVDGEAEGEGEAATDDADADEDEDEEPQRFQDQGEGPRKRQDREGKLEGVFVIENDAVTFRPVVLGITGEKDFEALEGLEEGEKIVVGPFSALRALEDGDKVKAEESAEDGADAEQS